MGYVVLDKPVEASNKELEKVRESHQLDWGFSLGFFNDVPENSLAYDRLKKDGIKEIIFYEPWFGKNTNEDVVAYLKMLTDKGFKVEVSLSNFPKEKGRDFESLHKEHGQKSKPMSKKKMSRVFKYSNRFPPTDYKVYTDTLKNLLDQVIEAGMRDKVSFEIGSEPNANMYWWGDEKDFAKYYNTVLPILKSRGFHMTCCGFSTGYFNHPKGRASKMHGLFDKFVDRDGVTQSYSMYLTTWGTKKTKLNTYSDDYAKKGQISAFGIYAKLNSDLTERNEELDTGGYMRGFLKMLKFTYKHKTQKVYLWKLMDVPKKKGTAGYFTVDGEAKGRYKQWMRIYNVIKDGFYINENDKKVVVVGKNSRMVWAKSSAYVGKKSGEKIVASYKMSKGKQKLEKHGWVILRSK